MSNCERCDNLRSELFRERILSYVANKALKFAISDRDRLAKIVSDMENWLDNAVDHWAARSELERLIEESKKTPHKSDQPQ